MFNRPVSILMALASSLFMIWCLGTSSIAVDMRKYLWFDSGYPSWWLACYEGYATWWHDAQGDNLGFPSYCEVMQLPSLTTQQRQVLTAIYQSRRPRLEAFWRQVLSTRDQLRMTGEKSVPGYTIPTDAAKLTRNQFLYIQRYSALIEEFHKARHDLWLVIQPNLSQRQVVELKTLAQESINVPTRPANVDSNVPELPQLPPGYRSRYW